MGMYGVFSDMYFPVYVLEFCPYTGKFGREKTLIFAYLMGCPVSWMNESGIRFE